MIMYAIKLPNGNYYAGCSKKREAKTLAGAQLYTSKKAAENTMSKSVNFPSYYLSSCTIMEVKLEEIGVAP